MSNAREDTIIHIRNIVHRGRHVWLVTFPYSKQLYNRCKQSEGRYSRSHKGWWWPSDEYDHAELKKRLMTDRRGSDHQSLSTRRDASDQTISDDVMDKIMEVESWMRQKRYSQNTIRTYMSFIKGFFAARSHLSWMALGSGIS